MKSQRQRRIVHLLRDQAVSSQYQLVKLLRAAGHPSTQATVSRDLEELGAVKVRRNGKVVYALPQQAAEAPIGDALKRVLAESLLSLETTGNMVVAKTPPGHAGMVAAAMDRASLEGIAGTVAGDDTILIVCKQSVLPRRVDKLLRGLAEMLPNPESSRNG